VHSASWVQTEELLDRKVAVPVYKTEKYGRKDPSRWPRGTFYPHKLAITSPTSGGRSVGIVRSRTQTMEFFFLVNTASNDCKMLMLNVNTIFLCDWRETSLQQTLRNIIKELHAVSFPSSTNSNSSQPLSGCTLRALLCFKGESAVLFWSLVSERAHQVYNLHPIPKLAMLIIERKTEIIFHENPTCRNEYQKH
jgi:hypothetical protein